MAWGFIGELPVSREEYDRLSGEVQQEPEGLILHASAEKGPIMRIIDVWESKEAFERFEREILLPALARIGAGPGDEPPPREEFEVHSLRGRAT